MSRQGAPTLKGVIGGQGAKGGRGGRVYKLIRKSTAGQLLFWSYSAGFKVMLTNYATEFMIMLDRG